MEVIGFDGYNFVFTGNVTQTLRGSRVDVINIPTVMIIGKRHGSDWVYSRPHNSKNPFRGGVAYTVNSRDYKGVMIVVLSEQDRSADGEQPSRQLLRTGCVQRYVCDGEK